MEDIKYCPIGSINCPDYVPCLGERCAWYIRGRCALVDIADSLAEIAMNTAALE